MHTQSDETAAQMLSGNGGQISYKTTSSLLDVHAFPGLLTTPIQSSEPGTRMTSLQSALAAAVASALLTACASGPAPLATASLPVALKKPAAAASAKKPATPTATAYDGLGSKSKCGQRHLAYQAGQSPEATMQEKVARDLECTPL
jgi:hypothetical protein